MPNLLIYGTAWKKEQTKALVLLALKNGFRAIDTACQPRHYREDLVGEAVADYLGSCSCEITRDQLYIQTKFTPTGGQDPSSTPYDPKLTPTEQVLHSFEISKENLKTDFIDGYLLHSPVPEIEEIWNAMESIYERGEVGVLGISNCYDPKVLALLYEKATVKPRIIQNRFYADTGYDREIRTFCQDNGILYQSFWSLTANPHILSSETLFQLARKYERTEPEIFYRFLTQSGIIPLNGTTSEAHMKQDLSIFSFDLSEEERESIDRLLN